MLAAIYSIKSFYLTSDFITETQINLITMLTFKKRLATIILLTLFSVATIVSCGKKENKEEQGTEHPADSTEHPSDSTEHPSDSTEHPAGAEHPEDSTKK